MHAFAHEVSTQTPTLFAVFVGERQIGATHSTHHAADMARYLGLEQRAYGDVGRHQVAVRGLYHPRRGPAVWLPLPG